jgi:hypothetical protein
MSSMITDTAPQQQDAVVKTKGGSAGPHPANAGKLPPLPSCEEHPRRELDLYCKLCEAAICATCQKAEHSQCQKKWDEKLIGTGLTQSM